jgi:hypothetical protein
VVSRAPGSRHRSRPAHARRAAGPRALAAFGLLLQRWLDAAQEERWTDADALERQIRAAVDDAERDNPPVGVRLRDILREIEEEPE